MKLTSTAGGSTFGERFSFARWYQSGHVRHESDQQFARGVGRTKGAVSQWRKAVDPPPVEITVAIAQRTGLDAAWLLGLPNATEPTGFAEWLAVYRKSGNSDERRTAARKRAGR